MATLEAATKEHEKKGNKDKAATKQAKDTASNALRKLDQAGRTMETAEGEPASNPAGCAQCSRPNHKWPCMINVNGNTLSCAYCRRMGRKGCTAGGEPVLPKQKGLPKEEILASATASATASAVAEAKLLTEELGLEVDNLRIALATTQEHNEALRLEIKSIQARLGSVENAAHIVKGIVQESITTQQTLTNNQKTQGNNLKFLHDSYKALHADVTKIWTWAFGNGQDQPNETAVQQDVSGNAGERDDERMEE